MATISVERNHGLTQEDALERVKEVVADFAGRLKAEVNWKGADASFKGKGFSGGAKVTDELVAIDVDLGLMLRPLKSKIASRLEDELRSKFA